MPHPGPAPSRHRIATTALLVSFGLVACGDVRESPPEGGAAALDETVNDEVRINSLELAFPEDGQYEEGDDVTLYAALTNTGRRSYELTDVRGPDFADARLVGLDGSEGSIEVPSDDNTYLEPDGPASVVLEDLGTSLRSSESIEVTFVFGDAGEVTVEAPVAADPPGQGGFEAPEDPTPGD